MTSVTFPDPELARDDGLLCIGGDLEPETLLAAYARGIFPWFSKGQPVLWWSPDPRMVLFPQDFHCSRRLARRLRQPCYRYSINEDFASVIHACASIDRPGQDGTWIVPEMIEAYTRLHRLGYAKSFEVWREGRLVGGLYGVEFGSTFFAESMFSRVTDGSKMALAHLCRHALNEGWKLIDCQFYTNHLASLGAREISRSEFLELLQ